MVLFEKACGEPMDKDCSKRFSSTDNGKNATSDCMRALLADADGNRIWFARGVVVGSVG